MSHKQLTEQLKRRGHYDTFRKNCIAFAESLPEMDVLQQRIDRIVDIEMEHYGDLNKKMLHRRCLADKVIGSLIDDMVCRSVSDDRLEQIALPVVNSLANEMMGLTQDIIDDFKESKRLERTEEEEASASSAEVVEEEIVDDIKPNMSADQNSVEVDEGADMTVAYNDQVVDMDMSDSEESDLKSDHRQLVGKAAVETPKEEVEDESVKEEVMDEPNVIEEGDTVVNETEEEPLQVETFPDAEEPMTDSQSKQNGGHEQIQADCIGTPSPPASQQSTPPSPLHSDSQSRSQSTSEITEESPVPVDAISPDPDSGSHDPVEPSTPMSSDKQASVDDDDGIEPDGSDPNTSISHQPMPVKDASVDETASSLDESTDDDDAQPLSAIRDKSLADKSASESANNESAAEGETTGGDSKKKNSAVKGRRKRSVNASESTSSTRASGRKRKVKSKGGDFVYY